MTTQSKNPDFATTTRIPRETMAEAIKLSRVARELNAAEWLTGWTPPMVSVVQGLDARQG